MSNTHAVFGVLGGYELGKAIRYTVVTAIACVMILAILIATQEISRGMEYTELPAGWYSAGLNPEPTYTDINVPSIDTNQSGITISSIPQKTEKELETTSPSAEQSASETQSIKNSASSTPKPKTSAQPNKTTGAASSAAGTATPPATSKPQQTQNSQAAKTPSSYYKAPSGYTAFEDSTYFISYPNGWAKGSVGGDYSGTTFTSPADSSGDTLKLTLISTEVNDSDALDVFADSGSKAINEVLAGFGVNASVTEKSFESIGIYGSYNILIEVPNGSSATHIRQNYIKHGKMLTMVELSGPKGKVTKDQMMKILNTFDSKLSSVSTAN